MFSWINDSCSVRDLLAFNENCRSRNFLECMRYVCFILWYLETNIHIIYYNSVPKGTIEILVCHTLVGHKRSQNSWPYLSHDSMLLAQGTTMSLWMISWQENNSCLAYVSLVFSVHLMNLFRISSKKVVVATFHSRGRSHSKSSQYG